MGYKNLRECVTDLEKHGRLVRIREEVDPELEMAAIHRRVYEAGGPAIFYERIKGSKFQATSNLFGTLERSKFLFRDSLETVKMLVGLKGDPMAIFKKPAAMLRVPGALYNALPSKRISAAPVAQNEARLSELPQIKCWPMDGGPFVTLPVVYTEDADKPGIMKSNLGMYRIQLAGNDYTKDDECGLHYQLHRGIGVHQTKANSRGEPLKVSVFVGGPPSLILSGVMPLPEGMPEVAFSGALGARRFSFTRKEGFALAAEADFVICGEVYPHENKPEGPFGDHLGYYSLTHDFPLMRVRKVYHRNDAIWPFTVVGRPPQEDTSFGEIIHEIVGGAISTEIPGLHEVHAVDAAGVHPLLLAIGSERYTPYYTDRKPQEILTIANHILGTGQLSLAKYLWIACKDDNPGLKTHDVEHFFKHMLERADWTRDLHFHTNTSIDTLDYSGTSLNSGSKLVIAAAGNPIKELKTKLPSDLSLPSPLNAPALVMPGVIAIQAPSYNIEEKETAMVEEICKRLNNRADDLGGIALILITDDSEFVARNIGNFIWATFTRSNPSHDIYGVGAFTKNKHWGCTGPLVIDIRIKPHHAPPLVGDPQIEKRVDQLGSKGGSLHGII